MNKPFTVRDGLDCQKKDLIFWEGILKPNVYARLLKAVEESNKKPMKSGYDVKRGQDLQSFVLNIHNDYNPLK